MRRFLFRFRRRADAAVDAPRLSSFLAAPEQTCLFLQADGNRTDFGDRPFTDASKRARVVTLFM